MRTRYMLTSGAFVATTFLFWYAGVDFAVRSTLNAYIIFIALLIAGFTCGWPGKFKDEESK